MNKTLKLLMFSDIFFFTGFGFIDPILAIFIKDNLAGGTIFAAGIASALFLVTKSLVQLPFSRYVDKHDDKTKWLILGSLIVATVPFIYIFSRHIYLIFFAQVLHGLGSGLAYPTWLGLWSINLDKKQESFEWSLYSTLVALGSAATAAVGAALADFFGFILTFALVGIMSIIGSCILFGLERERTKTRKYPRTKDYLKKRL